MGRLHAVKVDRLSSGYRWNFVCRRISDGKAKASGTGVLRIPGVPAVWSRLVASDPGVSVVDVEVTTCVQHGEQRWVVSCTLALGFDGADSRRIGRRESSRRSSFDEREVRLDCTPASLFWSRQSHTRASALDSEDMIDAVRFVSTAQIAVDFSLQLGVGPRGAIGHAATSRGAGSDGIEERKTRLARLFFELRAIWRATCRGDGSEEHAERRDLRRSDESHAGPPPGQGQHIR
jgi:hypothetical protein